MKKRGISALLPLLLLLLLPLVRMPAPAQAAGTVPRIVLDGEVLTPRDATGKQVVPFVRDGSTYLPVRALGQAFGMDVAWDQDSNAAYVGVPTDGGAPQKQIRVFVDGNLLQPKDVNGKSVPPIAMEGTVYLPVRALAQALGCSVEWDQETRTVTLYSESTYHTEPWRLVYAGDWSLVEDQAYAKKQIEEEFAALAKPIARWGIAGLEPHTIVVKVEPDFDAFKDRLKNALAFARLWESTVVCRADQINYDRTHDYGCYFLHEFTHCLENYQMDYSWWMEHLANYSRFRYYTSPTGKMQYSLADPSVRDWNWVPNAPADWFLSYIDSHWPSRQTENGLELGLLDRLHFAGIYGEVESDGDKTHSDPGFNAIVREYTGASNMEELRKRYVRELNNGTWRFSGFEDMEDSFLTDDAQITVEAVSTEDNLLRDARILGEKDGYPDSFTDTTLTDGDLETSWETPDFSGERHPYAVWDLGAVQPLTSVTLLGYYTNLQETRWYPGGWDMLVSRDGKAWTTCISCRNATRVVASFSFPQVSARFVMLRLAAPADTGKPARIREFMVFGPDTIPADNTPVSTRTIDGVKWTGQSPDGTPDGYGRAEGPDGVYIGSFLWGERQGQGTLYGKDGSVLESCWIHGVLWGQGRLTRSDGSRVIGTWENGKLNGTAWEVKTDGTVLEQTWDNGTLQNSTPMARTTWEDGYTFEGYRIRGKAEGNCKRTYNGHTFEGMFCKGEPLGQGKETWSTGDTFTGIWYPNDVVEGTYRWADGHSWDYRRVDGKYWPV